MCRREFLGALHLSALHARYAVILHLRSSLIALRCMMYVHFDGFIDDMGDLIYSIIE
jgi:hypothetical protein